MDSIIASANEKLEKINSDDQMRLLYDYREKARLDYNSDMYAYKEEGARRKAIEIAKKMLKKGFDIKEVAEDCELDIALVTTLKEELDH